MNNYDGHILIVGASAAGVSAAKEIRKINQSVKITIITEEEYFPYYRPFLTEYIGDKSVKDKQNFFLNKKEWYKENNINILLGEKVLAINTFNKTISTNKNNEFSYDKLILSNGSTPFIPIKDALTYKNVFAIRTYDDAKNVEEYAKNAKKVVIIGGGLLGLEAADSLLKQNTEITIVEFSDRLLPRQLDVEGSIILQEIIEDKDIKLKLGTVADKLIGDKEIKKIRLKNGDELEADLVIFSIGIRSNINLAEASRIETNRGIIVNDKMETNVQDIYACGDVCEFANTPALWMAAIKQGRTAGLNAIGENEIFKADQYPAILNSFNTRIYSVGDIYNNTDIENYVTMVRKHPSEKVYKKLFFYNGQLSGCILLGDIKKSMDVLKSINNKLSIDKTSELLS